MDNWYEIENDYEIYVFKLSDVDYYDANKQDLTLSIIFVVDSHYKNCKTIYFKTLESLKKETLDLKTALNKFENEMMEEL